MNKLTVAQLRMVPGTGGMSYVIDLRGEGFIIIDGGQGSSFYRAHADVLYNYLTERSGNEKPIILGWFFTHFHLDHVACAGEFLQEHKDDIIVKNFYINDAGDDDATRDFEMEALLQRGMDAHPDTQRHFLKTGEKICFPHCYADILLTNCDITPLGYTGPNNISAVFRIVFENGRSFFVTGDSDIARMMRLFDENDPLYRPLDELSFDIFQSAHHGRTLGTPEEAAAFADCLRQLPAPSVCFFPIHKASFETDPLYIDEKWADNQYMIHCGARCFHHTGTVIVDLDDMSVNTDDYEE